MPNLKNIAFYDLKEKLEPCPVCNGIALLVEDAEYKNCISNKGSSRQDPFKLYYVRCNASDCPWVIQTMECLKPEEAVFTDDSEKNLKNAAEMGIKTILFTSLEESKRYF